MQAGQLVAIRKRPKLLFQFYTMRDVMRVKNAYLLIGRIRNKSAFALHMNPMLARSAKSELHKRKRFARIKSLFKFFKKLAAVVTVDVVQQIASGKVCRFV